jgi:hypothetical protein
MGVAAIEGYKGSNGRAMDLWEQVNARCCQSLFSFEADVHLGVE